MEVKLATDFCIFTFQKQNTPQKAIFFIVNQILMFLHPNMLQTATELQVFCKIWHMYFDIG